MENLYAVDWLKIEVHVNHNQHALNDGMRVDIKRNNDGYDTERQYLSFHKIRIPSSFDTKLSVKSLSESTLQIEGNFYKWLNGQNVTGSTDLVGLVFDVVQGLSEQMSEIKPTLEQMNAIKQGLFKIHTVDINKALLFQDHQEAMKYLERLKYSSSYPNRKNKQIESNGVYFNKESKRSVIKYYHKGTEILNNKKHQTAITHELSALADMMIRCEMRIKWQELRDLDLLTGDKWDHVTVKKLIDKVHSKLRLPEPIGRKGLPKRYLKFISCAESGTLVDCYSSQTISKMTSDLIRNYGIHLN